MPTASFQLDSPALHQRLAWNPDQPAERLDIRITADAHGIHAHINDAEPIRLSDIGAERTDTYRQQLARMLAHYPARVHINDLPQATDPYHTAAGVRVTQYRGNLLDPAPQLDAIIRGKGYPCILLNQVLYQLDTDPEQDDYAGVLEHRMLNREDGQPHFARISTYQVTPAYRHDAPDLRGWQFETGYGHMPHRCRPPADVMHTMAMSQRAQQEQEAAEFIRRHSKDGSPFGNPRRFASPRLRCPETPYTYTHGSALPLVAFGQEVYIDPDAELEQATALSVARGLYAAPRAGLVPVAFSPARTDRAKVSCEAVTVTTAEGATVELNRRQEGCGFSFVPPDDADAQWQTDCRRITARLVVTEPDGSTRHVDLPLDVFLSGDLEDEYIRLTADWTADHTQHLQNLLFLAYWPDQDPPEHIDESRYRKVTAAMAANLLQGPADGMALELGQLADDFWPLNRAPGQAMVIASCPRHSLLWQPPHDPDLPVWLTAAIAGQNPAADAEAVRQQATAILADPDRFARLRELLAIPTTA